MKANSRMLALMGEGGVSWPLAENDVAQSPLKLEVVEDFVLLRGERNKNRHLRLSDFPDKTAFESLLNHVHLAYEGTNNSLISCLSYAAALGNALSPFAENRSFRVIVSISDTDCTVRFHQERLGEDWIAKDLEGYKSEAILVFDVPS